jgi:YVTN family beta-propeller protein
MRFFRRTGRCGHPVVVALAGLVVGTFALVLAFAGSSGAARGAGGNKAADPPYGLFSPAGTSAAKPAPPAVANPGTPQFGQLTGGASGPASALGSPSGATVTSKSAALPAPVLSAFDPIVPVGTLPTGVAANNSRAYVTNSQSNNVSVIDLTASPPVVVATIPVGAFPVAVALSPDNSQAYVTNYNVGTLSIIDTGTNLVTNTVTVGSRPDGVIRVGALVYVANLTGNSISVVNPSTATVTNTVTLGGSPAAAPSGLATNAAGDRLYVDDAKNGKLIVLNLSVSPPTILSSSTTVGTFPAYLSVAGTTGYVANPGSNTVSVVNVGANPPTVTATVPVGTSDYGIVAQPSLNQVFVTNSGSNNLMVINTGGNTVVNTFATGAKPDAIALTPDGMTVVVTNEGDNTVSIFHVNQKPVNTVPGAQTVNANGTGSANTLTFSVGNSNAISIADDAGTSPIKVSLGVSHGVLTLPTTTGLSFSSGANGTAAMTFTGTLTDVNAALAGLVYTPTTGYHGADTLSMTTDDQGSSGIGQAQTDSDTVGISVVNVAPVVGNVSFSGAVGNTSFGVGVTPTQPSTNTSGTVLSNSTDPNNDTLSAVAGNITTANSGAVSMNANGTFTYISAPGFTGADTFTFMVSDGITTTSGTATVNVANRVWYVNNALGSNGNGTSISPFNTLANLRGAGDADSPGDFIFLYQGSGNYTGGLPLEANESLIGQPEGLVVNAVTLLPGSGSNPTIANAAGNAIDLANGVVIRRVNATAPAGTAVNGASITTADYGPNTTISGSTSGFVLSGAASGDVTVAASITQSNSAGSSVSVANRSGGTVTFSGPVNDTGGGISLSSNTGATVNFTGGVTVTRAGTPDSFSATGGGTVSVTGSNNTLDHTSGTGIALNVQNTTIGASGLNFKSISANGGTNGIMLVSTGSSGGLTVSGTGTSGSGGTIQNTTDSGVQSNGTSNLNLSWMTIQNDGNAVNEGGVRLLNVFGTGQLTSSSVTGSSEDNVHIENSSGTLTSFTVQGPSCFVGNNNTTTGNIGVGAFATNTANMTVTVNNCSFSGNRTETLRGDTADSSALNVTFTNNTITAGTGGNNQGNIGINVSSASTSTLTFLVQSNKIGTDGVTNAPLMNHGINVFAAGSSTITGKVLSNTVRMAGAGVSGTGIRVFQQDSGVINANVDSNTVSNVGLDFGIDATDNGSGTGPSTGKLNIAVTNNNASTLSAAINAIRVRGRRDTTTCARITGNTATTNGGGAGLSVSQANTAVYDLEAPPAGAISAATAQTRLASLNPAAVGVSASAATNFTAVNANSCSSIPT